MSRVLVVCADRVGTAMAGPAIRCWEMCRLLAERGNEVHLAAPERGDRPPDGFEIVVNGHETLAAEASWADVIVVQGLTLATWPVLKLPRKCLVIDLYDPFNLEILELFHDHPLDERLQQHHGHLGALVDQLHHGDFFLCASEKQRDYWLGMLSAAGRVNPHTHGEDRLLRRLLDTVPFGTASEPPLTGGRPAAKGVLPGIGPDDRLVIWGGGVYNWFDPLSLIRAWPAILARVPQARLLFLGMRHPNPDVPAMAMAASAISVAEELGLRDTAVHFNTSWVPYDRRSDFLLEADLGVSTHFDHVETAFSFRTRILDYIWAGLPVVATEGDEFARWIEREGTGRVVGYEDPGSIASAIGDLLADPDLRERCAAAVRAQRPLFTWQAALEPLARYCDAPWHAADILVARADEPTQEAASAEALGSILAPRALPARIAYFLRHEGAPSLARRMLRALLRRLRRQPV